MGREGRCIDCGGITRDKRSKRCRICEYKNHSKLLKGRTPKNLCLINASKKGEGNPAWVGDKVKYFSVHSYIRKIKTKQKGCSFCHEEGKLYLSNISGNYLRDVNDYRWLCARCHQSYDKGRQEGIRNLIKVIKIYAEKCEDNFTNCMEFLND